MLIRIVVWKDFGTFEADIQDATTGKLSVYLFTVYNKLQTPFGSIVLPIPRSNTLKKTYVQSYNKVEQFTSRYPSDDL